MARFSLMPYNETLSATAPLRTCGSFTGAEATDFTHESSCIFAEFHLPVDTLRLRHDYSGFGNESLMLTMQPTSRP